MLTITEEQAEKLIEIAGGEDKVINFINNIAVTGALLILLVLILVLFKYIIKWNKNHKQDKAFEAKKKKYESFNHNSGEAWDYESARAYSNEGQEFN